MLLGLPRERLRTIRTDTREHIEDDILVLVECFGAKVIKKPHKLCGEWWATILFSEQGLDKWERR